MATEQNMIWSTKKSSIMGSMAWGPAVYLEETDSKFKVKHGTSVQRTQQTERRNAKAWTT